MKTITAWLIIRNGTEVRLTKKSPELAPNEVAIKVIINTPTPPRIVGNVTIDLPEPPPTYASAVSIDYPDDDAEEAHRLALQEELADE